MAETRIRFEGGPLDGTERRKTVPARSPIYLTTEGTTLYVQKGDRILYAVAGGRRPNLGTMSCYTRKTDMTTEAGRCITYRFITCEETQR